MHAYHTGLHTTTYTWVYHIVCVLLPSWVQHQLSWNFGARCSCYAHIHEGMHIFTYVHYIHVYIHMYIHKIFTCIINLQVLSLDPSGHDTYTNLAHVYAKIGRQEESLRSLEVCVCVCVCACACVRACVSVSLCACVSLCVSVRERERERERESLYVCVCICVCVHLCACFLHMICMYVYAERMWL